MKIVTGLIAGIVCTAVVGGAAHAAEDTLKPGKWQVVTDMQGPKPQMPPGAKLPPGVEMRPDGSMHMSRTVCVSAKNPIPVGPPPMPKGQGQPNCKVDKLDRNGGDVQWASTCNGPQGAMHADGEMHYQGDTMDANMRTHATGPNGQPADITQHTTAKYLGPCTGK